MERPERGVVQLPAPPPDTVVVERPASGGHRGVPVPGDRRERARRGDDGRGHAAWTVPGVDPGSAAHGGVRGDVRRGWDWYLDGEPLVFAGARYRASGGEERLDCGELLRVGTGGGVPVFAPVTAESPYAVIWVPVRPGVWRMYLSGG